MVTAEQCFELAENFRAQNNVPLAVQMYNEVLKLNPGFGLVHINMAKLLNSQGNVQAEYEALKQFMNCNLTAITLDLVPGIKIRIAEIEKQNQPQPILVK